MNSGLLVCIEIIGALVLFLFLYNIGRNFLFHETILFYAALIYILFPVLGYKYFNEYHPLALSWVTYMKVPYFEYYSYALPAFLAFGVGLFFLKGKSYQRSVHVLISKFQNQLSAKPRFEYSLIGVGILSGFLVNHMPKTLIYILWIFSLFIFPGMISLYFRNNKNKLDYALIVLCLFLLFSRAIATTMFTIVIYLGMTAMGLILIKLKWSFAKKVVLFFIFGILLITLQFSKTNYRTIVSGPEVKVSFGQIFISNFYNLGDLKNINSFFLIYNRVNQGGLLSEVMSNIPVHKPYDNGKRLFANLISTVVPRILWPNKPMAGGKENMLYYANRDMDMTSMNVGPFGEGYGSFGTMGGILYMFFYGLFVSFAFSQAFKYCCKYPMLIIWLPILFYQMIYSLETDSMQALNSFLKVSLVLFLLFKMFPQLIRNNG